MSTYGYSYYRRIQTQKVMKNFGAAVELPAALYHVFISHRATRRFPQGRTMVASAPGPRMTVVPTRVLLIATATSALVVPTSVRTVPMPTAQLPSRAAMPIMQESEGEKSRGRTAVIPRPKAIPKSHDKKDNSHDANWKVLLHNDDVHTFEYCNGAICAVVRTIKRKKAHTITVQAHSMGTAVVTQTYKQKAKEFCIGLQKYGLTSSISPE